jgi:hypothetical protein
LGRLDYQHREQYVIAGDHNWLRCRLNHAASGYATGRYSGTAGDPGAVSAPEVTTFLSVNRALVSPGRGLRLRA